MGSIKNSESRDRALRQKILERKMSRIENEWLAYQQARVFIGLDARPKAATAAVSSVAPTESKEITLSHLLQPISFNQHATREHA